jgi:WD40 repeat protein
MGDTPGLTVWDVRGGAVVPSMPTDGPVTSVDVCAAAAARFVHLRKRVVALFWFRVHMIGCCSLFTCRVLFVGVPMLWVGPSDSLLVSSTGDTPGLTVWDVRGSAIVRSIPTDGPVTSVDVSVCSSSQGCAIAKASCRTFSCAHGRLLLLTTVNVPCVVCWCANAECANDCRFAACRQRVTLRG